MNPGVAGNTIRTIDKSGVETPSSVLDIGGSGAESLVTSSNPLPVIITDGTNQQGTTAHPVKTDASATTQPVSGPVTDTQLRASAVPVSLATAPTTPVTGTFWQTTQPVSVAALPLPSGAATSAKQDTGNTSLASIDGKLPATVSSRIPVDGSGVTQPVSIATSVATTVADGANAAIGTTTDASSASTLVGLLKNLKAALAGTLTIAGTVTATVANATLAAGTALIGKVASVLSTDTIYNGTTALTPKFAFATLSSTGSVVAAVSNKKIRVLNYSVMADAACTVYFRTITTTTQISGSKYIAANGGAGGSFSPVGHFETISGEALGLFITGTANVSCNVSYIEV